MLDKRSLNGVINYLENIIDVLNEAVVVLDAEHRVVEASDSFYSSLRTEPAQSLGCLLYDVGKGHWDKVRLHQLLDDLVLEQNTVRDYEVGFLGDDDTYRTFSLNARCFCVAGDPANLILITLRDITDLRTAQTDLEAKVRELEERNAALDTFADHVAHDLKNPVSSMVGFASLIVNYHERMSREDVLENAQAVIDSGRRIKEIIDALLLLARVDRAEDVAIEALDMHNIVEQTRRDLDHMIRDSLAEIQMPQTWPAAQGFAPWVQAIWSNYISNAIKYGGTPPVVKLSAEAHGEGTIAFWVQDNGTGLNHDEQSEIFQPFTRLATEEVEGHGLGLAVVRKIVERLGGTVMVESTPGHGSRFGFTLPALEE